VSGSFLFRSGPLFYPLSWCQQSRQDHRITDGALSRNCIKGVSFSEPN
jgi:hypothetical protein